MRRFRARPTRPTTPVPHERTDPRTVGVLAGAGEGKENACNRMYTVEVVCHDASRPRAGGSERHHPRRLNRNPIVTRLVSSVPMRRASSPARRGVAVSPDGSGHEQRDQGNLGAPNSTRALAAVCGGHARQSCVRHPARPRQWRAMRTWHPRPRRRRCPRERLVVRLAEQ